MQCGSGGVFCRDCIAFRRRCICFLVYTIIRIPASKSDDCFTVLLPSKLYFLSHFIRAFMILPCGSRTGTSLNKFTSCYMLNASSLDLGDMITSLRCCYLLVCRIFPLLLTMASRFQSFVARLQ